MKAFNIAVAVIILAAFAFVILAFLPHSVATTPNTGAPALTPQPTENYPLVQVGSTGTIGMQVYRMIDKDANAVCWIVTNGGISCLPISQTSLETR